MDRMIAEEVLREMRDEWYLPRDSIDYFLEQDLEDFIDEDYCEC